MLDSAESVLFFHLKDIWVWKETLQIKTLRYLFIYLLTLFSGRLLYFIQDLIFSYFYFLHVLAGGGGVEAERGGSLSILHRETNKNKPRRAITVCRYLLSELSGDAWLSQELFVTAWICGEALGGNAL